MSEPVHPIQPHDAAALDALVEAGFDLSRIAPELRARAERALALLSLLDPRDDAGGPSLIDATIARTMRAVPEPALSDADAAAVESLIDSGWQEQRSADGRTRHAAALLGALRAGAAGEEFSPAERQALTSATMSRIQAAIDGERDRLRFTDRLEGARGSRFRLADVAAVAAMLLVAFGVLWPMASSFREAARITDCADHLHAAGLGFGMYANDHFGALPVATAGFGGSRFWEVGTGRPTHSSALFRLAHEKYSTLAELSCPGNSRAMVSGDTDHLTDWRSPEQVSFSYQLPSRESVRWQAARDVVVLADKSPVIDRARRGEFFDPLARSVLHRGRGQNVLLADGSVRFLIEPVMDDGDNIWLPASVERALAPDGRGKLRGVERPEAAADTFVAP